MCVVNDKLLGKTTLLMACLVVLLSFRLHGRCADDCFQSTDTGTQAVFSTADGEDHLVIPVETLGEVRRFLIDTGASVTVYDSTLAPHLKRTAASDVLNGSRRVPIYETPGGTFGPFSLRKSPVIVFDLSTFRESFGHAVVGVVGMNDLQSRILRIDFDNGCTRFLSKVHDGAGDVFDLEFEAGRVPTIKVALDEHLSVRMVIDTGSNSELGFKTKVFDSLVAAENIETGTNLRVVTVAGIESSPNGSLDEFRLGRFSQQNLSVTRQSEVSIIGLGYLSRFQVTLDFPNKKMFLKPGKNYGRESWRDMLGAVMCVKNDEVVLLGVEKTTPADDAGLSKGDVILEVNGRKSSEFSLFQLRRLFGDEGMEREIKFRRGEEVRTVNVLLRRLN